MLGDACERRTLKLPSAIIARRVSDFFNTSFAQSRL